ncbi:allose kinase [Sodalis sp. dw_96]|uniref:allose kinase n=1 Tax=Sodalis sp. dw_96 TaxID=2719794 RepID=UPI001BD453C2|nr:allose kinase [Sodalis sp. dw_96]
MRKRRKVVVGVDMGATHIRICLLTGDGQVLITDKERTRPVIAEGLAKGLTAFIKRHLAGLEADVAALMIGFPASIGRDKKTIISVPNLPCDAGEFTGLAPCLEAEFFCPVTFERDVNMQLYYDVTEEKIADKLVLGCYLGTGFGFGVWLNGGPYVGAHGVAGELGHIPLGDPAARCGCGNPGCLETLCSGAALARWYAAAPRDYPLTELFTHGRYEKSLMEFIDLGAKAIATGINLFDPEYVLLGGGVMDMADFPYDRLVEQTGVFTRKPLPFTALTFAKASSSSFNGAIGAARMGLDMPVRRHF